MTIFALASGTLFRQPERKVAKNGKAYVSAKLRVGDADNTQWVHLVACTAQAELEPLDANDAIAVQGSLKAEVYTPAAGEPRVSLSISVASILPLRRRKRKQAAAASSAPPFVPDYDDGFLDDYGGPR